MSKNDDDQYAQAMMAVLDEKVATGWMSEGSEAIGVKFHELEQRADDRILDELAAVGDTLQQMSWRCGWLTEDLYRNLIANGFKVNGRPVDYLFVCYYVSVTRLRGQRSMSTVKKWALTARYFPPAVAEKFHRVELPFSHFTYAASFGDQAHPSGKKMWQAILEHSWDEYLKSPVAKTISVKDLEDWVNNTPSKKKETKRVRDIPGMTPMQNYTAAEEEEELEVPPVAQVADDPGMIISILSGLAQNFVLATGSYLPVLALHRPHVAKGLAGLLELMRKFVEEINNP